MKNGTLHSLLYNMVVTFFVILFFGSRLLSVPIRLCNPTVAPRPVSHVLHIHNICNSGANNECYVQRILHTMNIAVPTIETRSLLQNAANTAFSMVETHSLGQNVANVAFPLVECLFTMATVTT